MSRHVCSLRLRQASMFCPAQLCRTGRQPESPRWGETHAFTHFQRGVTPGSSKPASKQQMMMATTANATARKWTYMWALNQKGWMPPCSEPQGQVWGHSANYWGCRRREAAYEGHLLPGSFKGSNGGEDVG